MFRSLKLTLSSPTKAFEFTANQEGPVKLGRSLKCQFSVPLDDLSREHCSLELKGEEIYLTDLGSSNGVWVNRVRLEPHKPCLVTTESTIVLASIYYLKVQRVEFNTRSAIKNEEIIRDSKKGDSSRTIVNPVETNTVSFQLDYPVNKDKRRKKKPESEAPPEESSTKSQDVVKMVVGFLVALGFAAYYLTR